MTDPTTRGDRLKAARIASGYTNKSDFARRIAVRPETLWRYETNREQPSAEVLARASALTGVAFERLYGSIPHEAA
jgi:transcriptional regulator with XRE-family HTH domain